MKCDDEVCNSSQTIQEGFEKSTLGKNKSKSNKTLEMVNLNEKDLGTHQTILSYFMLNSYNFRKNSNRIFIFFAIGF